jgi:sporulation protein YlmC with PRC-barrel domain
MFTSLARDDMLVSRLIGQPVVNEAGEKIGDVDDLIMDKQGHISAALTEVGGYIGVEKKLVAIPFNSLSIDAAGAGKPRIVAEFSKPYLAQAPLFKAPEQLPLDHLKGTAAALGMRAAEKASEIGHRAADTASKVAEMAVEKASELGHKATGTASEVGKKIADMGPDLIQKAAEKASEVGQKIADKTSELIQKATEKAAEVGQKVAEKSSELTGKVARQNEDPGQSTSDIPAELKDETQQARPKE